MADADVKPIDLAAVRQLVATTETVVREALEVASKRTDGGKNIDDEQVHCERLAYAATEGAAARDLAVYGQAAAQHGDPSVAEMAGVFAAEVAQRLAGNIDAHATEFGLSDDRLNKTLGAAATKALIRDALSDARVRAIGRHVMQQRGVNASTPI